MHLEIKEPKFFVHQGDISEDFYRQATSSSAQSIAIDTESMGLKVGRDRLCLVQLSLGNGEAHIVQFTLGDGYACPNLKKLLIKADLLKIFHYARADIATLQHYLNLDMKNVYCTKVASRLARTYTGKHGLQYLCQDLLGIKISKQQQSSDWGGVLSEEQINYAAGDVIYLHRLHEILNKMLVREKRNDLAQACFAFLPTRAKLDVMGWRDSLLNYEYDDQG